MIRIILHIIPLLLLVSCIVVSRNETVPARPGSIPVINEKKFYPTITIYHQSSDTSVIYVTVKSDDLLYIRTNAGAEFTASVKINYQIYKPGTKIPLDTGSIYIHDAGNAKGKTIIAIRKIQLPSGTSYESQFKCEDMNREEKLNMEFFINKENSNNRQYFLLLNDIYKPILSNSTNEKSIWLAHSGWASEKLHVRYYNRKINIPPPPFSDNKLEKFSYKADSLFTVTLNDSGFVNISLREKGFYHFQKDTTKQEGFTLFVFKGDYPEITHVDQLAEPLRFLCSSLEYESIVKSDNIKSAVDNFWLDKCGSKERARETIKQYYGRVEKANKQYTSFVEGWKTDRGMISIIFGEPHSVSKSSDTETWYYNNDRAYSYITFTFIKVQNPFTDNDYILTRDPGFKPQWYRAVESWRQGRAYNANNF